MVKRIFAVCLALVISCTVAIKPLNVEAAAESGILGGALASMGVSLSVPQIALLVAAAGGAVYLYENREAVADSLETYLDVAAADLEERKQQLQDWWNAAKLGHIAISTAQDWIKDGVKSWIHGLYTGKTAPVVQGAGKDWAGNPLYMFGSKVPAGSKVQWGPDPSQYYIPQIDCIVVHNYFETVNSDGTIYIRKLTALIDNGYYNKLKVLDSGGNTLTCASANKVKGYWNIIGWATGTHSPDDVMVERWRSLRPGSYIYNNANYSALIEKYISWNNGEISLNIEPMQATMKNFSVGGLGAVYEVYDYPAVWMDDVVIDNRGYITADTTKTGEAVFEDSITQTLTGMQAGTITWTDYVTDVSSAPTVALPDATDQTITNDFVIGETGVTDTVVTPAVDPPELENYKVQLKDFFPFCLPFDIVSFIGVLAAEPEAPKMDFTLPWIEGDGFTFTIDLSKWDPVAEILRTMELLALIVGLGFKTREMIRG